MGIHLGLLTMKYIAGRDSGRKLFKLLHDIVPEILLELELLYWDAYFGDLYF